jgi:hypothetical protein
MMKHLSEEQIVLHYYGDAEDEGQEGSIGQHLRDCSECRHEFERVQRLLQHIEPTEVPEPPEFFEEKMWLKLSDRLPATPAGLWRWLVSPPRWAVAAAVTVLLIAAFTAGRFWPRHEAPGSARDNSPGNPQRVVLVAVSDHLERSQMLLVEIMNADAKGPVDLGAEQKQARELLDSNYLYRVSAERVGDPQTARLLDELGRALTEIANSPSQMSPGDLQQIQGQIQSDNLLFKVRVVGSEVNSKVRRQEGIPAGNASQRL